MLHPLLVAAVATGSAWAQKPALTVDLAADAATLDPHVQWDTDSYSIHRNIFDNLVTRDAGGAIVPQVATAWRYTDDKTVVFDIGSGITFQDGSPLTPEDVAFSVNRIIDPAFESTPLSQYDQITSAEVTGTAQVTLHTKTPSPVLLAQLVKLSIVPKAVVQKLGHAEFNQHPVGSGPYRLHLRGKPPFDTVVFRAVPDATTWVADLRLGWADLVRGLSPDDAEALKSDRSVQLLTMSTERVAYLCGSVGPSIARP